MWKFKKVERVKSETEGKVMPHGVILQARESDAKQREHSHYVTNHSVSTGKTSEIVF